MSSLFFLSDCISGKGYWIMNYLLSFFDRNYNSFQPLLFLDPLDLEMTRVTIITFKTDMRGPLVTVHALCVLQAVTVRGQVLVHDLVRRLIKIHVNKVWSVLRRGRGYWRY
jgi:hypothetical protein